MNNILGEIVSCENILKKGGEGLSKACLTKLKYHAVLARKERYSKLICMLLVMSVAGLVKDS